MLLLNLGGRVYPGLRYILVYPDAFVVDYEDYDDAGVVEVKMTLTTPGCPVAQTFPGEVENAVRQIEGVTAAQVELVWDPPWCADNLSMEVKLQLGLL